MYSVKQLMRVSCLMVTSILFPLQKVNAESCSGAGSACKVEVQFKGTYLQDTCDIIINNGTSDETVIMPTLSTQTLKSDGAEAGSTSFSITLKSCPASKTISLWFAGAGIPVDSANGNLTNSTGQDYSENVQVRLRKASGAQMVVEDRNSLQEYVIPPGGDDVTHDYQAMYYANGATSVTPGLVSTMASINLTYP